MSDVRLKCTCEKVQGIAHNVTVKSGNRIVCHCDDCQSFANYLNTGNILDEHGGTDIFQMSYADVEITKGASYIKPIRLTPKGLYRWYADCCKTPIGNTISGRIPFIGVIHNFMDDTGAREENLGVISAHTFIKKSSPAYHLNTLAISILPRIVWSLIRWKIRDSKKRNPFFDTEAKPISEPVILEQG